MGRARRQSRRSRIPIRSRLSSLPTQSRVSSIPMSSARGPGECAYLCEHAFAHGCSSHRAVPAQRHPHAHMADDVLKCLRLRSQDHVPAAYASGHGPWRVWLPWSQRGGLQGTDGRLSGPRASSLRRSGGQACAHSCSGSRILLTMPVLPLPSYLAYLSQVPLTPARNSLIPRDILAIDLCP